MKSKFILSCIFVGSIFNSSSAHAWGYVGHRASGLIAQDHLTPRAKAEVAKLLGKDDLGDAANWADEIRSGSRYKQTTWYHFEKVEDGDTYIDTLDAMTPSARKRGGMLAAILLSEEILRSPSAKTADKTVALKFLTHFVGDLHQPLHSGRPGDKGGVDIPVTWFGTKTSLHGVWDSKMILTGHEDLFRRAARRADDGAVYAEFLSKEYKKTSVDLETDIERWLEESMDLRASAYDRSYQSNQSRYQQMHLKVADLRIYESGLRMAAMINDIFDETPFPSADSDLRRRVEDIVGDLDAIVNFKP